ncbi:pyridine nucleotide-disulfide oxidoreductase [Luteimonas aestuarii]|uniref:Pyridine nucleotide-disulfide oxidoreductase n=1 Tax=Luteimonas aestuarii TaxID=453837 RepID=A0A4R5U1H2_9GAMM|nr:FAD/NAD(P)-binding protein [Luteimonas aestuarii]TDK27439.1 pyridine nucleotide-disulfide oxidoreductase [Luteimonas aestuarii]
MRITIIGAGFSGCALALQLADTRDDAVEVCVAGVPATFGRGVAYGEARPEHLLKVRARHLGIDPDNPDDFAEWLNLSTRARDAFLPRIAYGEYLHDRILTTREQSSNLSFFEHEVIAIEREPQGFRVFLADGSDFASDCVVLALGALPPQRLAGVGPRLARHARYIGWPWHEEALDRIQPDERVLIIGTGLTMADVVTSLHKRGHRGEIVALSRHGLLPLRHLPEAPAPIRLPPSVLHALRTRDVRRLLAAVRSLACAVPDWRSVVDALRPHTQAFWQGLPAVQRARFLRHLRTYWEACRHRLAPRVAAELDLLAVSGQLQVRAGRLLRAGLREDGVDVVIRHRFRKQTSVERFDRLVRATGLDTDITRTTHPLVTHMLDAGLVRADAHGLGIMVDDGLGVLDASGFTIPGLYCLGPLLRGHLWEITAVQELRTAAGALAQRLLEGDPCADRPRLPAWPWRADADRSG